MRRAARPVLVCLTVAAALLVTAGVLDEVLRNGERVRVAFLPPWESGAGLLLATFVVLGLVVHRARSGGGSRQTATDVLWPPLASAALLLPFLPVLPDVFPVLQILAGPLRWVVWLVIVALAIRTWWHHWPPAPWWLPQSVRARTIVIGLATALACGMRCRTPDRNGALPRRRRAALPGHRAEPVAGRRPEDREQPPARRLP